ncbi:MAG: hypothetical protein RMA76_22295 [Deltaproteobacteria bacterium]|jgi:hypothetical protein
MYRHRRGALIAAGLVSALAGTEALAVERVGIVVSLTVNVTRDDANALADELAASLEKELKVDVISGEETERRLPTGGLDEECIAKAECLKDLSARLEARQLLMLVLLQVGDALQIDTTWVDAEANRTLPRDAIRLESGAAREPVFRRAAPGLLPGVERRPPEQIADAEVKGEAGDTTVQVVATPEPNLAPVFAAGGVGAALLIGGIVAGVSAASDESSLEDDMCDRRACDASRVDAMETKALVADLLYAGALVSAGVAVVLYVLTGDADAEPSVEVAPTRDGVRASWGVRF